MPDPSPTPPVPIRHPHVLQAHGDERVDDWYWLGDRENPEVLPHLQAENDYAEAVLEPLGKLREGLYREMVARIVETDLSVPVRRGPWWYYQRTVEGQDYAIHCRRPAQPGEAPPDDEVLLADTSAEEILLDENSLAEGHEFLQVANLVVSPDHSWLSYAVDTTGGELFDLRFRRLDGESGTALAVGEVVADTYYGLAWSADNAAVFYTRVDEAMRPCQLWRHRLGADPATDALVLHEPDQRFTLSVGRTKDGAYVVVSLQSTTTSEVHVIPADQPDTDPRPVARRRPGVEYGLEHHRGRFVILTNDGATDFRLVTAPATAEDPGSWIDLLPERPGTRIEGVDVFEDWLVVSERLEAEPRLRVVSLASGLDDFGPGDFLGRSWLVPVDEHPATTWEGANPEPDTTELRYAQTSLASPPAVFDLELADQRPLLRKRQPVLGDFDRHRYRTFRLWAEAEDGTAVPISVVHRVELTGNEVEPGTAPAEPAPCLLYGYGAYEASIDPAFSSLRLSLLDRGFVYAVAHVRGGGELGRRWYEDGKLAFKEHTFTDFVACARHLVNLGFTAPDRLAIRGASAGGLLIGAVLNEAPDLFAAAVAEVPFVDCLTTMLDDTLPLTVGEWEEWGNPEADAEAYRTIKAYSPYDNVRTVPYPPIYVTAGLNDQRVGYWEPAKWVARLRAAHPQNRVLLRTELGAGHAGPSGRYESWKEEALVVAFILDALGASEVAPLASSRSD